MKHSSPRALSHHLGLGLVLALAACSGSSKDEPVTDHVLLITCDTLRADRLGMYGYPRGTSPNLDAFAREGVVFDEAYSTAPMTLPAISSMLTGRLPIDVGVDYDNHRHMPGFVRTLPEVLGEDLAVSTGAVVSNWLLRRPEGVAEDISVWQGFDEYDDRMDQGVQNRGGHWERTAPRTTDAAIEWLERHQGDERTFLWVHYQDPHGPYTPPAELAAAFAPEGYSEDPVPLGQTRFGRGQIPDYQRLGDDTRPETYRARYDAEIAYFDRELGRLFEWLHRSGRYDDTLIVFTADHGESLGEHGFWFSHGENVFREVVRVPLVVRMPGGKVAPHNSSAAGFRRVAVPAGLVDVWPTVIGAYGGDPGPSRGVSLVSERPAEPQAYGQFLYAENDRPSWQGWTAGQYRVLQETLPSGKPGAFHLYDVRADPSESNDLAASGKEILEGLNQTIFGYYERTKQPTFRGISLTRVMTPEELQRHNDAMKATGYAGDEEDGEGQGK